MLGQLRCGLFLPRRLEGQPWARAAARARSDHTAPRTGLLLNKRPRRARHAARGPTTQPPAAAPRAPRSARLAHAPPAAPPRRRARPVLRGLSASWGPLLAPAMVLAYRYRVTTALRVPRPRHHAMPSRNVQRQRHILRHMRRQLHPGSRLVLRRRCYFRSRCAVRCGDFQYRRSLH